MKLKGEMKRALLILFFIAASALHVPQCIADDESSDQVAASPNNGWSELPTPEHDHHSFARKVVLWVPNRVLDFLDIFRLDVGVGPAAGAVVRVTKYGQIGYRQMLPMSLRAGLMGRRLPLMVEHGNEIGAGPLFLQSEQRKICPGEIGVGVDLFIVGGYAGICVDEIVDFAVGIFGFDPKDDDFH